MGESGEPGDPVEPQQPRKIGITLTKKQSEEINAALPGAGVDSKYVKIEDIAEEGAKGPRVIKNLPSQDPKNKVSQ